MKEKIASLVGALTLLEWGGILVWFHLSGRVKDLLHPIFRPQILVVGILLLLGGVVLLLTRKKKAACGCGTECEEGPRPSLAGSIFFPFVLLVPFGVAALNSPDAYGANIIQTRGMVESAAGLPGLADKFAKVTQTTPPPPPAVEPALPGDAPPTAVSPTSGDAAQDFFKPDASGNIQASVADLLYAAQEPTLRPPFAGKSAEMVGQFMPAKRNNPDGNRFKLVRMFMICCASDAQPVSLLVELPKDAILPKGVSEMAWTKVIGEVTFPLEEGKVIAVLKAKTVEASEPPEESMLY